MTARYRHPVTGSRPAHPGIWVGARSPSGAVDGLQPADEQRADSFSEVGTRLEGGSETTDPVVAVALTPNELLAVFGMVVIDDHHAVVVSRHDEDDESTEVVYVNDTYTRLTGFKLSEVYGGPLGAVVG